MTGDYLLRIGVAAIIGAAIGAEREYRDKAAGLRTIMLICIGSALFAVVGLELVGEDRGDPGRMASSIVSGVGFLGAGVIFRRGKQSTGITTAATIWCAAALGLAAGAGRFELALAVGGGILAVLWLLPPLERFIDHQRESKTYEVKTSLAAVTIEELHAVFDEHRLKVTDCSHGKRDDELISEFRVIGRHDDHTAVSHKLIDAPWISEFR